MPVKKPKTSQKRIHTPTEKDLLEMRSTLAMALDPVAFAAAAGLILDPWQQEVVRSKSKKKILCVARQSGKTTISCVLALHTAMYKPKSLSLILAPSERQSKEALSRLKDLINNLQGHYATEVEAEGQFHIILSNGSRIIAGPGSEATTRGFTINGVLIIDEASRTDDRLYAAVSPALAVGGGSLIAISTPAGCDGWFYNAWYSSEDAGWKRWQVTALENPRIDAAFLAAERVALGDLNYRREFLCEFISDGVSVFDPDAVLRAFNDYGDDEEEDEDFVEPSPLFLKAPPAHLLSGRSA